MKVGSFSKTFQKYNYKHKNIETLSQTLLPFLKERKGKSFKRKLRFIKYINFIMKHVIHQPYDSRHPLQ